MKSAVYEQLEKCTKLPTLSSVALEVLRVCQADQLDLRQLAIVIGRDPALAITVVRTANSPLFTLRQEVTTIQQALAMLGADVVRTLVLTFSLVSEVAEEREGALAACWRRSVWSSIAARCLCELRYPAIREEAFLAGLLQDVGMMALARAFGDDYQALCSFNDMTHDELCSTERAVFGADHAEVGAWLLARWDLPNQIVELVGASHAAGEFHSRDATRAYLAKCVQFSGRMADLWVSQESEAVLRSAAADASRLFAAQALDFDAVAGKIVAEIRSVAPLFQITITDKDLTQWVGGQLAAEPVTA